MTTKEFDWADHFEAVKRLGISTEDEAFTYRSMIGGVWSNRGERRFHEPRPELAQELYTMIHSRRLEEAAIAAGFDDRTVLRLVSGDISAETLGLEVR